MNKQALMEKIVIELTEIYPQGENLLSDNERLNGYIRQLEMGLEENHLLQPNLIKNGFKKMRARNSAFYPSVGEFVSACEPKPEDFDELTAEEAYLMAGQVAHSERKQELPKCVYWAAKGIWKQIGDGKLEKEYKKRYLNLFSGVLKGLIVLDEIPQALPPKSPHKATESEKEQGHKVLTDLIESVNK